jgi:hypothetical protein
VWRQPEPPAAGGRLGGNRRRRQYLAASAHVPLVRSPRPPGAEFVRLPGDADSAALGDAAGHARTYTDRRGRPDGEADSASKPNALTDRLTAEQPNGSERRNLGLDQRLRRGSLPLESRLHAQYALAASTETVREKSRRAKVDAGSACGN